MEASDRVEQRKRAKENVSVSLERVIEIEDEESVNETGWMKRDKAHCTKEKERGERRGW